MRTTSALRPQPTARSSPATRPSDLPFRVTRAFHTILGLVLACLVTLGAPAQAPSPPTAAPAVQAAVPALRQASTVVVIPIRGEIDEFTSVSVRRRLDQAVKAKADAVVIELDTPGGAVGAVLEICHAIKDCPIQNSVAWVHSTAYSGGCIIALACREIVHAGSAVMGDALPIIIGPGGLQSLGEAERQKILAPLIAELVDSARRRGWDEYLVQGFVSLGVRLWLVENSRTGQQLCVDADEYRILFEADPPPGPPDLASSRTVSFRGNTNVLRQGAARPASAPPDADPDSQSKDDANRYKPASPALAGISGDVNLNLSDARRSHRPILSAADRGQWKLVRYVCSGDGPLVLNADALESYGFSSAPVASDAELKAFFGAKSMSRSEQNWSEDLASILSHMWARYILIAVFLVALFVEMTHPGVILPGAVAFVALGLLAGPSLIAGLATWWAVIAIIVGIVLVLLELLIIPGFGVPGILGLLAIFGGLIGLITPASETGGDGLLKALGTVVLSGATAAFAISILVRYFGSVPLLNRLVLKDGPVSEDESMLMAMTPAAPAPVVGSQGLAVTPLRPTGRAQFGDHILDVTSGLGFIPAGATVVVTAAEQFRTVVEELKPGSSPPPSA